MVNLMPGVSRSDTPDWMSRHGVHFRVVDRGGFSQKIHHLESRQGISSQGTDIVILEYSTNG